MAKVLIIDDEDVLLEMIVALIEELGYQPLTATNGREALNTLQASTELPALILSDVMMPHMNGVEFARTIKSDPRFRHVPLVLMSAAGPPHHDDLAEQFIHKPFDVDDLSALIKRYVSNDHWHGSCAMGW